MDILLVEDNPSDARLVELMLQHPDAKDARLTTVGTFAETIAILERTAFDIILLDLGLPDAEGLDLVHRLRAISMTPIVVLSGTGDETVATMAVREGAQDYLVKGHVDEFLLMRSLRYAIERGAEMKRMARLAFYDALTGLQNRQSFMLSFEQTIERAQREGNPLACLFIDLDGFKEVNDNLGHEAGDQVLIVVAQILRDAVRGSDIVGRLGGDEFVVVLGSIKKVADAAVVASKILAAIDRPIEVQGKPVHVTASIGVSFYPEDAEQSHDLLRFADEAMYRAKTAGKNQIAAHVDHPARRSDSV